MLWALTIGLMSAHAQEWSVALGGGLMAIRDAAGLHHSALALGLSSRRAGDASWHQRVELAARRPSADAGSQWSYRQNQARVSAAWGWSTGTGPARFEVEAGPAMTWRQTRWLEPSDVRTSEVLPGARGAMGLYRPVGEQLCVEALAGVTSRGLSADYDLMFSFGGRI